MTAPVLRYPALTHTSLRHPALLDGAVSWGELMIASLRERYLSMGAWLDSNPAIETELLARMQPGEYLYETFGPPG